MRILSLGGGVQSSTLLLMAKEGDIAPIDAAIFADTGFEPQAVYKHLEWLETVSPCPIVRVSTGNLRQDVMDNAAGEGKRTASLPLFAAGKKPGMLRRQCTSEYKIIPIRRWLARRRTELLIGISSDEAQRMKDSDVKYITNSYPLCDMRMSRRDCLKWLSDRGHPEPPKSACIACPFHDNGFWHDLKKNSPGEFSEAVEFDAAIRRLPRIDSDCYVHSSRIPLPMVDFRTEREKGQLDLFGNECEGMCGL